jgi:hypothetical protein
MRVRKTTNAEISSLYCCLNRILLLTNLFMKITSLSWALCFILLFGSCSNEGDVEIICYPTRISETRSSFDIGTTDVYQTTWVTTYSYSGNELAAWSGFNLEDEVNYPGAIEINHSVYDDRRNLIRQEDEARENIFVLNYDNENRLIEVIYSWKGNVHNRFTFDYNGSGQMIEQAYYSLQLSVLALISYVTYEYPNTRTRNFHLKKHFDSGEVEPYWVNEIEWDSKKSPYNQLPSLHSADRGENNITKIISDYRGDQSVINYTYTYNTNGYPVTRTHIPDQHPELVETFTFEYNCH